MPIWRSALVPAKPFGNACHVKSRPPGFEATASGAECKVWDGRANVEEVELNSPTGPIEGLTLHLYNP